MKLAMLDGRGGPTAAAVLSDTRYLDLRQAARATGSDATPFASVLAMIRHGDAAGDLARRLLETCPDEAVIESADAHLLCPLQPPRLRDTLMFLEHMKAGLDRWARNLAAEKEDSEAAYEALKATGKFDLHPVFSDQVIYYNANHLGVSGPDEVIVWPAHSDHADFELELGCVLGRAVKDADEEEAAAAIFGYTIYNDWSARDLQLEFMQANLGPAGGKDLAGGNTLGPWIVTADEIADPYALRMISRVNGEVWTDGSTSTMHHRFPGAIAQFSRTDALVPGEVIGSGTVLNGCGFEQGRKLNDGDVVELEIEGIGILRNRVRFSR